MPVHHPLPGGNLDVHADPESATGVDPRVTASLDVIKGWGRRHLIVSASADKDTSQADLETVLEQFERDFFRHPAQSLTDAFAVALDTLPIPGQLQLSGFAAAAVEGESVVSVSFGDSSAILNQDGDFLRIPIASILLENDRLWESSDSIYESTFQMGDRITVASPIHPGKVTLPLGIGEVESLADSDLTAVTIQNTPGSSRSISNQDRLPRLAAISDRVEPQPSPADPWVDSLKRPANGLVWRPPGSDSLRRYRGSVSSGRPSETRACLPRGLTFRQLAAVVLMAAVIMTGVVYALRSNRPSSQPTYSAIVGDYQALLSQAAANGDDEALAALVPTIEQVLQQASTDSSNPESVAELRRSLVAVKDNLAGVQRMENVRLVGSLPDDLANDSAHFVSFQGNAYLVADRVYQVQLDEVSLWPVEMGVFETETGIRGLTGISDGNVFALAGEDQIVFLSNDLWPYLSVPAELPGDESTGKSIFCVFSGRLYLLSPETGEIFVADPEARTFQRWLAPDQAPLPSGGVGMVIDGGIHVVYPDGAMYSLYDGRYANQTIITAENPLTAPQMVMLGNESELVYIADAPDTGGRLITFDPETGETAELLVGADPEGFLDWAGQDSFSELQSLVIDESTGKVLWIANGAIWQAEMPGTEAARQRPI